jgi:hypothetical protein
MEERTQGIQIPNPLNQNLTKQTRAALSTNKKMEERTQETGAPKLTKRTRGPTRTKAGPLGPAFAN